MVLLLGYQLGWYGYATLQQPVSGGCVGFTDLILPGRVSQVDNCISNNWGKSGGSATPPPNKVPGPGEPGYKGPYGMGNGIPGLIPA